MKIKTKRLLLELVTRDDLADFAAMNADEAVRQFYPSGVLDVVQTEKKIIISLFNWRNYNIPYFAIRDEKTLEFIGRCGFNVLENGDLEIEYLIQKNKWNNGYATEAVRALLSYAKENIDQAWLYAITAKENLASQKVLLKCGLQFVKEEVVDNQLSNYFYIENKIDCLV